MPTIRLNRSKRGFTLIELMITVALIGVLAVLAVPNFIRYQARSRRSEAMTNVAAIAKAQKSYQAERNSYIDTANSYPGGGLGTAKRPWDAASQMAFEALGWEPEGQVFYDYAAYTSDTAPGCNTCELCFTAVAYGDVDGNNSTQVVMYVHPENGVACEDALLGNGTPVGPGGPIYDAVAARSNSDF